MSRKWGRNARRQRENSTVVCDLGSRIVVTTQKRKVRILVVAHNTAYVHLDEEAVDKLVRRLQAVRGGKQARARERVDVSVPMTPKLR